MTEPVAPVAPVQPAGQTGTASIPVAEAPGTLQALPRPVTLPGVILSVDSRTGEVRVQTDEGEVVLRPQPPAASSPAQAQTQVQAQAQAFAARLSAGMEIALTLFMQKGQLQASAAPARAKPVEAQQASPPPPISPVLPPAPAPVRAGDVLAALKIPAEGAAGGRMMTPPQDLVRALQLAADPALPQRLPVPPAALKDILSRPWKLGDILRDLPAAVRAEIARMAPRLLPEAPAHFLQSFLDPLSKAAPPALATPPPPATPAEEREILFPATPLRPTQRATPAPAPEAPTSPLPSIRAAMPLPDPVLRLIEAIKTESALPPRADAKDLPLPDNLFRLTVRTVIPPGTPAPSSPPGSMTGEVESLTPAGHPVIRAPEGHFVLRMPAALPPGTQIVFTAEPMGATEALTPKTGEAARPATPQPLDPPVSRTWPALEEMIEILPAPQASQLRQALPTPTQSLPPTALLFLAALRQGDVEKWLGGDMLQGLRRAGRKDVAERLAGDFSRLSAQAQETLPGGWKLFSLPLLHDGTVQQARIFVRRQEEEKDGEKGRSGESGATRFVLNLSFSRLGDMQLDGLVRRRTFDLILRTETPMTSGARHDITRAFASGLGQTGYTGGIGFQARRQGWVAVAAGNSREETLA